MRWYYSCALMLFFGACDQRPWVGNGAAEWEGSIGSLVVDSVDLEAARLVRRDGVEEIGGSMSVVPISDADFDKALRLETLGQSSSIYSLEATLPTSREIEAGAPCWLHLKARAVRPQIESGLARLGIGFGPTRGDQETIDGVAPTMLDRKVYVEPAWTSIDIPFQASDDVNAGEAEIVFGIGTQLQVIDIGEITLRCFEGDQTFADLPKTSFTYAGRSDDAPWRETAKGHIDRYRRGNLAVRVVDLNDLPVPDAEIRVQMIRHSFYFGTVVDLPLFGAVAEGDSTNQEDVVRFREVLQDQFNMVALDSSMKGGVLASPRQRRFVEDVLSQMGSLDLAVRGSRLISGVWSDLPADLQQKRIAPKLVRSALRNHVSGTVGALQGRVAEWDVVDRPSGFNDLIETFGWQEVDEWFKLARAADNQPRLFLNEGDVLDGDRLVQLVRHLSELTGRNVPIDAIGVRGHFSSQPPSIQVLSDRLDQLASFGLPIMITRFDMESDDLSLKVDFTRDLLTLAFSHPAVEGFLFSGIWAGRDNPADVTMFREDWTINPIGNIFSDLVLREWWTDDIALSNADGDLLTRGFLGDYIITAQKDGLMATTALKLDADGVGITLKLDRAVVGENQ